MEFNDKWTKEVNDQYRKMIKEKKSTEEIIEYFGELIKYNPKGKYNRGVLAYNDFSYLINEIKMHSNYIHYSFDYVDSIRYEGLKDIRCFFNINDIDYILLIETFIENNDIFKNKIIYNVGFTTLKQYNIYNKKLDDILKNFGKVDDDKFNELKNIFEAETNLGDIIKIFNALSYIILKMSNRIENFIIMIGDTDNGKKIHFYNQSIKDSFDNYELIIGKSDFYPGVKTYYYKINK